MRRMADLTESRVQLDSSEDASEIALPEGVVLYEINGPLFFGAAQKAMGTLNAIRSDGYRVLVIHLGRVPAIDATGLVALENALSSVLRAKRRVVIAGPLPRPHEIFAKARLTERFAGLYLADDLEAALLLAQELAARPTTSIAASAQLAPR
jgi:SulP family sulfate permease